MKVESLKELTFEVIKNTMPLHEALTEIDTRLYPDIEKAGGLSAAMSKSLADIGSNLRANKTSAERFIVYARVEEDSRSAQVYIAGGQRLFLFDFWAEGVLFGNASCDNLGHVARAIHIWIVDKATIEKMSSLFAFFTPTEHGKTHEAGAIVEHQWRGLLGAWQQREKLFGVSDHSPTLLIEAAMNRPELRQLFPYTSLTQLCFSRTTGYPFTKDCPVIVPEGNGRYFVCLPSSQAFIGEGTIDEVVELAVRHLPPNCGPAVNGTADDFVPQQP